jgi:predicted transcriptional regulator
MSDGTSDPIDLATELTIAWLTGKRKSGSVEEVQAFLRAMHATVSELSSGKSLTDEGADETAAKEQFVPAVTARRSLASKDHILSMIDGKPYKTLRRHLSGHGLTPEDYRRRYNLRADYPMVAENYSAERRAMALKIGLGQQGRTARAAAVKAKGMPARPARRKGSK